MYQWLVENKNNLGLRDRTPKIGVLFVFGLLESKFLFFSFCANI